MSNKSQQLGLEGVPDEERQRQSRIVVSFEQKLRDFAQVLFLGFDPKTQEVCPTNTDAAVAVGLGNTRGSAKTMGNRYKNHPIVTHELERLRGELALSKGEVLAGWRDLLERSTGKKPRLVPLYDGEGKPLKNGSGKQLHQEVYDYDGKLAETVLGKMALASGLIETTDNTDGSSQTIVIAAQPEKTAEEWAAQYATTKPTS